MKHLLLFSSVVIASTLLNGCATSATNTYDSVIHGQVVERVDQQIVVNVGSADHVSVGVELSVVRQTLIGNPKQVPYYVDSSIGILRVVEVLSPHRARAALLSGTSRRGDLVEARRPS